MTKVQCLCLDIATKTGWAHSCGMAGVQDFKPRRGDSPGIRFLEFRAWLLRVLDTVETTLIAYEQAAHHRSNAATHVCHGLIAVAEQVAAERKIEITNRSNQSIKSHVLKQHPGKKSNKNVMVQTAENRFGVEIIDDNHADAIWLLDLIHAELNLGPVVITASG